METEVTIINNELNFYKYAKLLYETCTKTMLIIYQYLYDWADKCPHKLADHLNEVPVFQPNNKALKDLFKGAGEITKIEAMNSNKEEMQSFDITFFFKLIQYATNNENIKAASESVWNRNCPENLKGELEYLLFLVKSDRNEFNHKSKKFLNLKDDDIQIFCATLITRLSSIIRQVGLRTGIEQSKVDEICDTLIKEIKCIRDMKEVASSDEKTILKIMVEKDIIPSLKELKRCFGDELKSYCAPNFKVEDRIISTNELLADIDFQLICIYAEAGYGKTSFTKYVQFQLLLNAEKAGNVLDSLQIPIRIACRNISGRNISEFLEEEIPFSRQYASDTSLKKFLERINIQWIIDGYDERTAEFSGFFQSLLKMVPRHHKIIVTSRPDSLKEIKNELRNWKVCEVSIECFANPQIKEVAEKYLGEDKASDFTSYIENLNDDTLEFVKIPINLILCLELWFNDPTVFHGNLITVHKLYRISFDRHCNLLVHRHTDKTKIISIQDLKRRVEDWFHDLCKILAECAFSYELNISESQCEKLMKSASQNGLLGSYCLSTFFNSEKSSHRTKYFIKHKIQKEILVCLYLKRCDYNEMEVIAKQNDIIYLLKRKNPFRIFKFLMECCDSSEFSRIFALYLDIYPALQRPDCLLQIKNENEEYFDALKNKIRYWDKLVLIVEKDDESMALMNVIQHLSSHIKSFKLIIGVDNISEIDFDRNIHDVLKKYEDRIELKLVSIISDKMATNFWMFKPHFKLIKEVDIRFSTEDLTWQKDFNFLNRNIKDALNLKNLQNISIDIDGSIYFDSFLYYLASPLSFIVSRKSCHALFIIKKIEDPSRVTLDLLQVTKKFLSISVNFELNDQYIKKDIDKDLLKKFEYSEVQLKQLQLGLGCCFSQDCIWMQFMNCKTIESLNLCLWCGDDLQSLVALNSFFQVLSICKETKLKEISFKIATLDQMNILLDQLPPKWFDESVIKVRFHPVKWLYATKNTNNHHSIVKRFKKLEILRCEDAPSVGRVTLKTIEFFKVLTNSLIIYGVPYSSQISDISVDELKIKDVAVKYLGDLETEDFVYCYRSSSDESKDLMKTELILKFCLSLWKENRSLLKEKLTAYKLFEKQIHLIVEYHYRDQKNTLTEAELKVRVTKWFDHLCKIAASIMFTKTREFRESDEYELMDSSSQLELIGSFCLSPFLDHDELSLKNTNKYFKGELQNEVLAYFGVKMFDKNTLNQITEEYKSIDDFQFLLEWGDSSEFARIISIFITKVERSKRIASLVKIKEKNENCFDALMKAIYSNQQSLELYEDDVDDSFKMFLHLSLEGYKIKIVSEIASHEKINAVISKYKNNISFHLKLKIKNANEAVSAIYRFREQESHIIREFDFSFYSEWDEEALKVIFNLEHLENVSFYVNCHYYSASFLAHFALLSDDVPVLPVVSSHFIFPSTSSNTNNPGSLSPLISSSLGILPVQKFCHAHFSISNLSESSEVIIDLLNVNTKFQSISVELELSSKYSIRELDINLQESFLSSSVQVKTLKISLDDFSEYPNLVQLINCVDLQRLELILWNGDELASLSRCNYLFNIWDFDQMKKLKEITIKVKGKSPFIVFYDKLSSDILDKTTLYVNYTDVSSDIVRINLDSKYKKQFKQIRINDKYYLSATDITLLRCISKSVVDYKLCEI